MLSIIPSGGENMNTEDAYSNASISTDHMHYDSQYFVKFSALVHLKNEDWVAQMSLYNSLQFWLGSFKSLHNAIKPYNSTLSSLEACNIFNVNIVRGCAQNKEYEIMVHTL